MAIRRPPVVLSRTGAPPPALGSPCSRAIHGASQARQPGTNFASQAKQQGLADQSMKRTVRAPRAHRPRNAPGTAWTRGDGGMEGPVGWSSGFGRAGFASSGDVPKASPNSGHSTMPPVSTSMPERPLVNLPPASPSQGDPSDAWDRPYGSSRWGGPAGQHTPEQDRLVSADPTGKSDRPRQVRQARKTKTR
jgi:hypothetical protein